MRAALLIIAFLLGCSLNAAAQKNLVRNGDMEQYYRCPPADSLDFITVAKYWSSIDTFTYWPTCAPDYMNACAPPYSAASVPEHSFFFQYPHSGNGMAQVTFYTDESHLPSLPNYDWDYLQGRLYKKLTTGKSYCVSFYVNLEEVSKYAIKDIDAYLDNGGIDKTDSCWAPQTQYTPQVSNAGGIITDTAIWTKIEGSFVANGSEQFITIGNYKNKAGTTYVTLPRNPKNAGSGITCYLIDDVSVVETGTPADAGADKQVRNGDSVYIGLPSSEVIWNSWRVLGDTTVIGEGPGIWVKPKVTTSYIVTQTLCGTTTTDTVEVEVRAAGIHAPNRQNVEYSIVPNPNNGSFAVLRSTSTKEHVVVDVTDVLGRKVYSKSLDFGSREAQVDLLHASPGIYMVTVYDAEASYNFKVLIQ